VATVLAIFVALWAVQAVPVVPITHSYRTVAITADTWIHLSATTTSQAVLPSYYTPPGCNYNATDEIPFTPNDISVVFVDPPSQGSGGTFSGTFSDPSGTPIWLLVSFGWAACFSLNATGSFLLSSLGSLPAGIITVQSPVPTTVYVNGTYSYLAPLVGLL
jgi:hypothetical protein